MTHCDFVIPFNMHVYHLGMFYCLMKHFALEKNGLWHTQEMANESFVSGNEIGFLIHVRSCKGFSEAEAYLLPGTCLSELKSYSLADCLMISAF